MAFLPETQIKLALYLTTALQHLKLKVWANKQSQLYSALTGIKYSLIFSQKVITSYINANRLRCKCLVQQNVLTRIRFSSHCKTPCWPASTQASIRTSVKFSTIAARSTQCVLQYSVPPRIVTPSRWRHGGESGDP